MFKNTIKVVLGLLLTFSFIIPVKAAGIAIDEEHFPDVALRDYLLTQYDTNEDKSLSQSEINKVTYISIYKYPFDMDDVYDEDDEEVVIPEYTKDDFTFDFKGLELFPNLKTLHLYLNGGVNFTVDGKNYITQLYHMDTLYKLPKLTELDLYEGEIKGTFDFNKLKNLKNLTLYDIENIKELKLNSTTLKKLWLEGWNNLTTLDLSQCTKLNKLYLQNNDKLKTLKLGKKNKSITSIQYEGNKISKVNWKYLKGLKKLWLTNVPFKKVNVKYNKALSFLSFEDCTKLKKITVTKNINLKELYVMNCRVKTLNLKKNKKLKWLWLEGKTIKTVKLKQNKLSYIRWVNSNMKTFNLKGINPYTIEEINVFANPKLKKIDVSKLYRLETLIVDKSYKGTIKKLKKTVVEKW